EHAEGAAKPLEPTRRRKEPWKGDGNRSRRRVPAPFQGSNLFRSAFQGLRSLRSPLATRRRPCRGSNQSQHPLPCATPLTTTTLQNSAIRSVTLVSFSKSQHRARIWSAFAFPYFGSATRRNFASTSASIIGLPACPRGNSTSFTSVR